MTRHTTLAAILCAVAAAGMAQAQGILVARDTAAPPDAPKAPLVIRSYRADVSITGTVATTKIDQVFTNRTDSRLEGTFYYPLPESAAITKFVMYIGSEAVQGQLVEKTEARRIYNEIVRAVRDPAVLEYAGRNLFKMDVFPIDPRSDKRIQLEYTQQLEITGGAVRYVHPLDAGRLVKYPIESIAVSCTIESPMGVKGVYSPSHEIDTFRDNDHKATAGFETGNVVPLKDFVLFYTLSDQDFGLNVLSYRPDPGQDGYFMLLLAPKQEFTDQEIEAKTVVFVFDTSGSMAGDKIEQARRALSFCLTSLNEADQFNVVTFATGVNSLAEQILPATKESISRANEFVTGIKARGGTNIEQALTTALKSIQATNGPTMVVFLTDGLPTVGVTDMEQILTRVAEANANGHPDAAKSRIFVFGVGTDVNTHLLDQTATASHAASQYVVPGEDIEVAVSSFYEKVAYPVMSDIKLDFGDVYVYDYYPTALPDIFRGSQVTLFGRYRGAGHLAVKLRGSVNEQERELAFDADFPEKEAGYDFIPRLWAIRRVAHLADEIRLHGESPELRDEVVALGKEWGLVTPYTSYLVLDEAERKRYFSNAVTTPTMAPMEATGMPGRGGSDSFGGMGGMGGGFGGGGFGGGMMGGGMAPGGGGPGMMGPGMAPDTGAAVTRVFGEGEPAGPKGDKGATGERGAAGPAGAPGTAGPAGPAGRRGGDLVLDERPGTASGRLAADWSMPLVLGLEFERARQAQTGEEAVELSQVLNRLKEAETEGFEAMSARVGEKTFYLIGGIWIDSALTENPQVTLVKYLSDAYFALANEDWLAQCLALGERVAVVLPSGRVVQVMTDADIEALRAAGREDLTVTDTLTEDELRDLMAPAATGPRPEGGA